MRYEETVGYVAKILGQYTMKLTLRQIYYRLVADFGLPNKRSSYNQLSRHLVKARENGVIDEARIEDRTRSFLGGESGFSGPDHFIEALKTYIANFHEQYDINLWEDQDMFIVIWIEKDALSRVIADAAGRYRVIVAPSRGYASYTYVKAALEKLPADKDVIVLHFADHDASGIDMTRDLSDRLRRYGGWNVEVERVALTHDQVKEYGLAPNPTKMADPRSRNYLIEYGSECWELDAIEPSELQKLVLEALESRIDLDQWEDSEKRLETERKEVKGTIDKWSEAIDEVEEKED